MALRASVASAWTGKGAWLQDLVQVMQSHEASQAAADAMVAHSERTASPVLQGAEEQGGDGPRAPARASQARWPLSQPSAPLKPRARDTNV